MKTKGTKLCLGLFFLFCCLVCKNVSAQLKADFTSNVQSGCTPLVVAFEDLSQGKPTSWTWSLGNGTVANNQNPVTTYIDPGTYTVKLSIKNSSGKDSITKTAYITVYANPQINFTASPTEGCYPLNVSFSNKSKAGSGTIAEYLWDYGDGYVDTSAKGSHTYLSGGKFNVTLKVTNSYGCVNNYTNIGLINIDDGVNANFNLTSLDVCSTPAMAVFENTSEGSGAVTYKWNFDDGTISTDKSPAHNYATSGSYNVLLTATTAAGCSDTATMNLNIHLPVTSFSKSGAQCLNQPIQFTNTSNPQPVSSKWYFSDGTTSDDLNPAKAFSKAGTYTVKLVNIFSAGCSDSTTSSVTIGLAPTTLFIADDTADCSAPMDVQFTNKTTGAVTRYLWDFGDGDTSTSINPSHTYKNMGNYKVTLTAFTENGCSSVLEKNKYIAIQPVKITGLTNLPDSGCIPMVEKPSVVLSQNYPLKSISWDFGDGSTSNVEFPTHVYTKEGFYNIKVSIVTMGGCTSSYTMPNAILAGHKPKASFSIKKDSVCASDSDEFVNTSTNGPITFVSWEHHALLDSIEGKTYAKKALQTGYTAIMLVVYNYGCPDTIRKDSAVYVKPPIARIAFSTFCNDKQRVDFKDSSFEDVTRKWDFGDGVTDLSKYPSHVYASPGSYKVTLVSSKDACNDTAFVNVHLINEQGKMSLPGKVYCRGNDFKAEITNVNLDNIKSTTWDFGDGTAVTVNGSTQATHSFVNPGKFKITATVIDKNGCQYYYENPDSVSVYGPLANYLTDVRGSCTGQDITFKDKSSTDGVHDIVKWTWDFGDSSTLTYDTLTTDFLHAYKDTGYNTIKLSVTDSYGCTDSIKKSKYVYVTHPVASFIMSDSIACPGKQVSFQNTSTGSDLSYLWDFGDGSQSSGEYPSHTYKNGGTYNPELFVTDVNGCRDSFNLPAITITKPMAKFSLSDSVSTCPPLEVDFTNKSTNYTSLTWDFGDGSPSIAESPTHLYTYVGTFPVKLIAKGYGGCYDTSGIKNITIKGPTGTLSYDATPSCSPATIQLSAKAKNVAVYTWDFSDGNTVSTSDSVISYAYKPGTYLPKLILQDKGGCKISIKGTDTLRVYDVKANANIVGSVSCELNPVVFTDSSVSADDIIHHYWYFGDNNTADQKSVTHSYSNEGNYDAYLVAVTKLGCSDTFHFTTPVLVLPKPDISIDGENTVCVNSSAGFIGVSTTDDSTIKWNWDLGNGSTFSGKDATATYNNKGSYTVNLVAINSGGCSDTTTKTITVNPKPAIDAGLDSAICEGSVYQLNASGGITYNWSGIGLSCTDCTSPSIKPDVASTYVVTGKDAAGCSNEDSVTISIVTPGKITVSGDDTLCIGENTKLSASGATSYQWFPSTYLDNAQSPNPVFTASTDTSITYKVVGHSQQNCFADTGYVSVKTYPIPKMDILRDEIVLNVGSSVQLHSNSSADITSWRWSPPQGLSNTLIADPVASPIQSTTYSVIASNGGSCVARDEITINVICSGSNVFIPNTFSPNNDGMNDVFYPRGNGLFKIKSFRVFNRWGQVVFEKTNTTPNNATDGWDGKINGKPLNSDVYVYIIEVLCANNMVIPFKGNITLIR